jgi:hypothetical protein
MLMDDIEKKLIKKGKKTQVNLTNSQNSWPDSWVVGNLVEIKFKNSYEVQFVINLMLKDEVQKKKY